MARRYYKKLGALAKIEATYGTSSVPTGALNALLLSNVTVTPLEGTQVERDLMVPYFGGQGSVLAGAYARVECSVEMAGAGAAGTAPKYAPLLRACGPAETLTATTKVEYQPVSSGLESATLFFNLDGVNHVLLGARGTFTVSLAPKQIPHLTFVLTGLLGPITDAAIPAQTYTGFQKPLVASDVNSAFTLHGLAAPMESFTFDLGNQVEPRMLIGSETIEIVDRTPKGTAVIEAAALAAKDWFALARASTVGPLLVQHGLVAGNIVELEASAIQIGQPAYGNTQGVLNLSLPLMCCTVAGGDDFTLRIR